MVRKIAIAELLCVVVLAGGCGPLQRPVDIVSEPYLLDTGLVSRSISFENPTGAPGEGGKAASKLGVGRKGKPMITLKAGKEVQLCDIAGPGTIRHIWMTTRNGPANLRSLVIRAWWDGQEEPSIECPIGDFMGFAHGKVMPYFSAVHSLGKNAGMNIWLPMPFTKRAKITLSNEGQKDVPLYYQIDYTIAEKHPSDVGRLHVLFRRENPTTMKKDFVSMYRWHLPDPIAWRKECRITIQQIAWKGGLAEVQDDWSCATFWYEPVPSAGLPAMPDMAARTADIWQN